ncbi:CHASE2 domain-containing protein [Deinococcus sp. PESE-13]
MSRFPERPLRRLTLTVAAALGLGLGLAMPYNRALENSLNRALPSPLDPRLLLVGIDDATLGDYGPLPQWPRSLYLRAFDTLEQAGAQVIGLDVVLGRGSDPDPAVQAAFDRPHLVLATAPGDPVLDWLSARQTVTGVSALNSGSGPLREVQTAYPVGSGPATVLLPSFARQVAAQAGQPLPLDTQPRLLRYSPPAQVAAQTLSFRDLVGGNVRYADLQGRVVLIGQNASGVPGLNLPDIDGRLTPGLEWQARAVSSLLSAPLRRVPGWGTALLCAGCAVLTVLCGGLWGYALAGLTLLAAAALWPLGVVFPGVSVSLSAVLGSGLVAFERWRQLKAWRLRDPLTGLGNRLGLIRSVTQRWPRRVEQPFGLVIFDVGALSRVNAMQGRAAGDALLRELSARLQRVKRRGDAVFRSGPDEFAVLLEPAAAAEVVPLAQALVREVGPLSMGDLPVPLTVGTASSTQDLVAPTDLLEAASRERYRAKYQRVQEE